MQTEFQVNERSITCLQCGRTFELHSADGGYFKHVSDAHPHSRVGTWVHRQTAGMKRVEEANQRV